MKVEEYWTPDAERLAQETEDLLRFGSRVLMAFAFAAAGVLAAFALNL